MKLFLFLIGICFLLIAIICAKPKVAGTKENETKQMMIIEDHLTGKIDTVWIDPEQNNH